MIATITSTLLRARLHAGLPDLLRRVCDVQRESHDGEDVRAPRAARDRLELRVGQLARMNRIKQHERGSGLVLDKRDVHGIRNLMNGLARILGDRGARIRQQQLTKRIVACRAREQRVNGLLCHLHVFLTRLLNGVDLLEAVHVASPC